MALPTSPSFPHDALVVRQAIEAAVNGKRSQDPAIRIAVEKLARNAQSEGTPPEDMLLGLKALVNDMAIPAVREWYRNFMLDRVISWAIQAYYGNPPA